MEHGSRVFLIGLSIWHLLLDLVIQLFPMKVLLALYCAREKPFFENAKLVARNIQKRKPHSFTLKGVNDSRISRKPDSAVPYFNEQKRFLRK